jgi:tetratricopeptide (TPR) repeat protein
MKHYYYAINDQQFGPFTVDELKTKRLKKSSLIWTEDMVDWAPAETFLELKEILISEPPPIPKKTIATPTVEIIKITPPKSQVSSTKYDLTYDKEIEATYLGVVLFAVPIIINFSGVITFATEESFNQAKVILSISSLLIRIAITYYVGNIASRQNRNSTGWSWFAFFLPSIALIVIGLLQKLRLKIQLDGNLSNDQQVAILLSKANQLFSDNRYSEVVVIMNKAFEIENQNFKCIRLRGLAYFQMKNYHQAKLDFETLIKNDKFTSFAYFYLGNLAIIDFDRELAIKYWLKADELKNENAKIKLDQFHTFTGNYLLDRSQVIRKVINNPTSEFIYFGNKKYLGGLPQIDQIEKPGSLKTLINCYDLGLEIELRHTFKTYYLGISYYEIENIIFKKDDNLIELFLTDENILRFRYDQTKDHYNGLKRFCDKFKQSTGKTPEASSFFKD